MKKIFAFIAFLSFFLISFNLFAQVTSAAVDEPVSKPILILFVLFLMSLAPFILMMTTSFVKIAVVLSLVRSALGVQQIPPNQVITGLALILTVYVMIPVGQQVYDASREVIQQRTQQDVFSMASIDILKKAVQKGKEPVREFLLKHTNDKERKLFLHDGQKIKDQ